MHRENVAGELPFWDIPVQYETARVMISSLVIPTRKSECDFG